MSSLHPISFGPDMIQSFQNGLKRQTRRVILHKAHNGRSAFLPLVAHAVHEIAPAEIIGWLNTDPGVMFTRSVYPPGSGILCPYGRPGDFIWFREQFKVLRVVHEFIEVQYMADNEVRVIPVSDALILAYRDRKSNNTVRPARFMPLAFSKFFAQINAVRAERLNDISLTDAIAEGIQPLENGFYRNYSAGPPGVMPITSFGTLWEKIHGKGSFFGSTFVPWVWVVCFNAADPRAEPLAELIAKKLGNE